ncbi:hypothetical protein NLG97_g5169 [Lecanicillium saksenae]|uniref:Uncharacterized protein n=1 Tax=Lecanicillium saksenae TaxID=468837 RepID=A0ACC1QWF6_9HYPO|nr:hypothetical protein NLG97_g5169 [Lecanicillium saksenae]
MNVTFGKSDSSAAAPRQIRFVHNQGQPPSKRRRINAACRTTIPGVRHLDSRASLALCREKSYVTRTTQKFDPAIPPPFQDGKRSRCHNITFSPNPSPPSRQNSPLTLDAVHRRPNPLRHLLHRPLRIYNPQILAVLLQPEEVAMVAAHMADLEAAKNVGLRTIYVERPKEEEWSKERLEEAKSWVDLWIKEDEGGFIRLAQRLEQLRQ